MCTQIFHDGRRFVKVDAPTPQKAVNRVSMYYQTDGTFAAERDALSIGLCVISLNGINTVILLEDCVDKYTYDEAIQMAKEVSRTGRIIV